MSLADASWLVAAGFFSLYGVLAAIESGVAVKVLLSDKTPVKWLFTPVWEITNVFLVFGFTTVSMLFSNALDKISHDLLTTLIPAATLLLLRALVVISIFYLDLKRFARWLSLGLALLTLSIPLLFASGGVYLLSGQLFWHTTYGWSLMATALLGLLSAGFLFTDIHMPKASGSYSRLVYFAWLGMLGGALPLVSIYGQQELSTTAGAWLTGLAAVGIVAGIVHELRAHLWLIASTLSVCALLLMAWFNRPDLIKGQLSLDQAFSGAAYAKLMIIVSICMLPLLIFGFWLFAKVLKSPAND